MMIEFHLDTRSGVAPYLQLIQQVRHALRLGVISKGDKLPTVKDVVAKIAINPNTVLKAYRELEYEGLVAPRPGVGTFVTGALGDDSLAAHGPLRADLEQWLAKARRDGLDDESIEALFVSTFRAAARERIMTAALSAAGLAKRYGRARALTTAPWRFPPAGSSAWSARTAPASPRCCNWPAACSRRAGARSRCSAGHPPAAGPRSASSPRTPRRTRA